MPCTLTGSLSGDTIYFLEKEANEATRAACEALTALEERLGSIVYTRYVSEETVAWWTKHKERDAARQKSEAKASKNNKRQRN